MDFLSSDAATWFIILWFAIFGGAVGSFLNVIVYRLPAGLNIAWPGSHCPRCKHAIRSYDNVPVLGWLWLRGRCRDCREPISMRYPAVEAIAAAFFVLLAVVEVLGDGRNLPLRTPPLADQPAGYPLPQALGLCLLHLGLLSTLLASALITLDGHRPPWRLFAPMAAVGFVAPMIWPWLLPQPSDPEFLKTAWGGVADSLIGLAIGYCLGRTARWLGRRFAGVGRAGYQILSEATLLGVVLGWRAAVVLVLLAMLLEELTRIAALRWRRLRNVTAAVWLAPLALLWILNWARLMAAFPAR